MREKMYLFEKKQGHKNLTQYHSIRRENTQIVIGKGKAKLGIIFIWKQMTIFLLCC